MSLLSPCVDRPIVDRTGLTGAAYEYTDLNWAELREERRENPMAAQASMFAALQDRLGLKLESMKEAVEVIVVDRAARPSVN